MSRRQKSKNRRGRPRKPDVKRTESGQISRAGKGPVRGTSQSEAWRRALVNGGNPAHADYPLGRLFAEGAIDDRVFRAGCRYAWVQARLYGRPILAAAAYGQPLEREGKDLSAEEKARLTGEYDVFEKGLGGAYTREKHTVDELIIREQVPRWMTATFPMWADVCDGELCRDALERLAKVYEPMVKEGKIVHFQSRKAACFRAGRDRVRKAGSSPA